MSLREKLGIALWKTKGLIDSVWSHRAGLPGMTGGRVFFSILLKVPAMVPIIGEEVAAED